MKTSNDLWCAWCGKMTDHKSDLHLYLDRPMHVTPKDLAIDVLRTEELALGMFFQKTDFKVPLHQLRNRLEIETAFIQTWNSTACGYGGIGGAAMSDAYTIVYSCKGMGYVVCIAGRVAYHVTRPNEDFFEDLKNHRLLGAARFNKNSDVYSKTQTETTDE